jgi:hypothetical protein
LAGPEATVKVCGVVVARLQGKSWIAIWTRSVLHAPQFVEKRHIDHEITVSGDTSFGSLIHAMLGSAGGTGGWWTKRLGCTA